MLNENWVWQEWAFKAYTGDCNELQPAVSCPDMIINTSTEHFDKLDWWHNIPEGMIVVLQGNNMIHDDHCVDFDCLDKFKETFPLSETYYSGQLDFKYETGGFSRYMVIGKK
jgi:hypothetical protein